jgi:transcriptional regulator of acetoin/glycerol metabolism
MSIDPLTPVEKNLTGNDLRDLLQKNADFIAVSRPFMENLHCFLARSGFLIMLIDYR